MKNRKSAPRGLWESGSSKLITLQTLMWVSSDWVEDMIMMGSIIMGKADRNDQQAAGYNVEQADMHDHNATGTQQNSEQADTAEYKAE